MFHLQNEWEEGDVAKSIDKTQLWVGVHLPHLIEQGVEYLSNNILYWQFTFSVGTWLG